MRRSDVFPSKWLRNEDLGGKPLVVTIAICRDAGVEKPGRQDAKQDVRVVHGSAEVRSLSI